MGALEDAAGYVVYGSDGRRVGMEIELSSGGDVRGDSLAIRSERIYLWRRRIVRVRPVAAVDPRVRTVAVLLDAESIERVHERHTEALASEVGAAADGQAPAADLLEDLVSANAEPVGETPPSQHVLFAPTAAGYLLIERAGAPPVRTATMELSDPPGRFEVVKLARSPLPDDPRRCAYLQRID